jgi:hypothetical protein
MMIFLTNDRLLSKDCRPIEPNATCCMPCFRANLITYVYLWWFSPFNISRKITNRCPSLEVSRPILSIHVIQHQRIDMVKSILFVFRGMTFNKQPTNRAHAHVAYTANTEPGTSSTKRERSLEVNTAYTRDKNMSLQVQRPKTHLRRATLGWVFTF